MSTRRKAGDWVWLKAHAGMVGESWRLKAEIRPEQDPPPCFLCDDPDCVEWTDLWTEPDIKSNGRRYLLCHVSECQMFDERQLLK